jgi:Pregnancy-associated plasma protein-A
MDFEHNFNSNHTAKIMRKISTFVCLASLIFLTQSVYAQSYTFQHETLPCLNKKFTIVSHIFPDSLGNYGVSEGDIKAAVVGMNGFFSPICVSFEVCEFRYHPNFQHDTIDSDNELDAIKVKYHAHNRINFYFLSQLGGTEAGLASGSITDPTGSGIFIVKTDGVTAKVFAHEMGHFSSLAHTFEGNGTELVNGDNCMVEGDGICDTPADPFVPGEPMIEYVEECRFTSPKQDANGEFYNPDLGNIMSYYNCGACGFTWGQLNKMAGVIQSGAMKMW